MRLAIRRCGVLGCALAFAKLACLDAQSASAQSAERQCARPERRNWGAPIMVDTSFSLPLNHFREAEQRPSEQSANHYERAAAEMEAAVAAHPNHPQAALASFYVALAYERSGRSRAAMERYLRILRDYDATHDASGCVLTGEDLAQRINILEVSTLRAAILAGRSCEFDEALRLYREVVRDARFAPVPEHAEHVRDAVAAIGQLERRPYRRPEPRTTLVDGADLAARVMRATTAAEVDALAVEVEAISRRSNDVSVAAQVGLGDAYRRLAARSAVGQRARWLRLAIEHYTIAVRHAREVGLPSISAEEALDRLREGETGGQRGEERALSQRFPNHPRAFADIAPGALAPE